MVKPTLIEMLVDLLVFIQFLWKSDYIFTRRVFNPDGIFGSEKSNLNILVRF